jgi:hypothetical protein
MISWHFSAVTVSEKNIGPTIRLGDIAHQQPVSGNVVALNETSGDFHCSRTWHFVNLRIHLNGTRPHRKKHILQDIYIISFKLSELSAVTHPFLFINFFKFMTDLNSVRMQFETFCSPL